MTPIERANLWRVLHDIMQRPETAHRVLFEVLEHDRKKNCGGRMTADQARVLVNILQEGMGDYVSLTGWQVGINVPPTLGEPLLSLSIEDEDETMIRLSAEQVADLIPVLRAFAGV